MPRLIRMVYELCTERAEALIRHMNDPETAPHLALPAFLRRIVNGGGIIDRACPVGSGRTEQPQARGHRPDPHPSNRTTRSHDPFSRPVLSSGQHPPGPAMLVRCGGALTS